MTGGSGRTKDRRAGVLRLREEERTGVLACLVFAGAVRVRLSRLPKPRAPTRSSPIAESWGNFSDFALTPTISGHCPRRGRRESAPAPESASNRSVATGVIVKLWCRATAQVPHAAQGEAFGAPQFRRKPPGWRARFRRRQTRGKAPPRGLPSFSHFVSFVCLCSKGVRYSMLPPFAKAYGRWAQTA